MHLLRCCGPSKLRCVDRAISMIQSAPQVATERRRASWSWAVGACGCASRAPVSTRKYARSLEPLPDDVDAFGTSKSAVSRRFVKQTTAQVEEFLRRPLDSLRLCVL